MSDIPRRRDESNVAQTFWAWACDRKAEPIDARTAVEAAQRYARANHITIGMVYAVGEPQEFAVTVAVDMSQSTAKPDDLSMAARRIMHEFVVRQGLSYDEAIRRAEARAVEVAAPYRELADHLRRWLDRPR